MAAAVRAEHLTRRLAAEVPVTLVDDVSLEIERGECAGACHDAQHH